MIIGCPKRSRQGISVANTPGGAESLTHAGHQVFAKRCRSCSGFWMRNMYKAGARKLPVRRAIYASAEWVLKVQEPRPKNMACCVRMLLFTYLHLAAAEG